MRLAAVALVLVVLAGCAGPRALTEDQARTVIRSVTGAELRQFPNDGTLFAWHDGMVALWDGQAPGQNLRLVVATDTGAANRADHWFDDAATWTYLHHGTVVVIYSHEDGWPDLTGQLEAALNSA